MISNEYAAGFFDADGSVYARKRTEGRISAVTICITSVDRIILELHQERWGGSIAQRKIKEGCKIQYQWTLASAMSKPYMEDIVEFTVLKRSQLEIALKIRKLMDLPRKERLDYSIVEWSEKEQRNRHRPRIKPEFREKVELLREKIRALNKEHAPFNVIRHVEL